MNPPKDKREFYVFVSSTFRDMQAERDELTKFTFPKIRKLCEDRGLTFKEIDLRWGVTDEQAHRGEVLPICLAEIDRCRPYFIGILGERYGWIPDGLPEALVTEIPWLAPDANLSATEIEIMYGVLEATNQPGKALFYFRDPEFSDQIAEGARSDFVENAPLAIEKLANLKDRIRAANVIVRENYSNASMLGKYVLEDLTEIIDRDFPAETSLTQFDREAALHTAFAQSRTEVYVPRAEYFDRLTEFAAGSSQMLVVLGESGSGKSSLLANWAREFCPKHPEVLLVSHFVGASTESGSWEPLLRHLMGELKRRFDIPDEIPANSADLISTFASWLHLASAQCDEEYTSAVADENQRTPSRLILVIDALDQLEDRDGSPDLVWLPESLPENVKLIASALPGRALNALESRGCATLYVSPLMTNERLDLGVEYLRQYGKKASDEQLKRIASGELAGNPLFLCTLLEEIRIFGVHEQLEERISYYLDSDSIGDLFQRVLDRFEHDFDTDQSLVREAFSLLASARRGLSEAELLDLLGDGQFPLPQAKWSPIFLAARQALINRDGLLGFRHEYVASAVRQRYLSDAKYRVDASRKIANYFESRLPQSRALEELPWQLSRANELDRLEGLLSQANIARQIHKERRNDLYEYWSQLESETASSMTETYAALIANPENSPDDVAWLVELLDVRGEEDSLKAVLLRLEEFFRNTSNVEAIKDHLGTLAVLLFWDNETTQPSQLDFVDLETIKEQKSWKLLEEQEAIYTQQADKNGLQLCLGTQAQLMIWSKQYWLAKELLDRQEIICKQLGNKRGEARAAGNRGYVHNLLFEEQEALDCYERAEALCRETSDLLTLSQVLDNRAQVFVDRRLPYEAVAVQRKVVELTRQLGFQIMHRLSLSKLGQTYLYLGSYSLAQKVFEDEEVVCRRLGDSDLLDQCSIRQEQAKSEIPIGFRVPPRDFRSRYRREGIVGALEMLADEGSLFSPSEDVLCDIRDHIVGFVCEDLLMLPEAESELARISGEAYRQKLEDCFRILKPAGDALYANSRFRESASSDEQRLKVPLQIIGSQLMHQVLPSKGFEESETLGLMHPFLRCHMLLDGWRQ